MRSANSRRREQYPIGSPKPCPDCGREFPYTTEFFGGRNAAGKPGAYCKPCHNKRSNIRGFEKRHGVSREVAAQMIRSNAAKTAARNRKKAEQQELSEKAFRILEIKAARPDATLEEISQEMGITRERVRQYLAKKGAEQALLNAYAAQLMTLNEAATWSEQHKKKFGYKVAPSADTMKSACRRGTLSSFQKGGVYFTIKDALEIFLASYRPNLSRRKDYPA